MAGRFSSPEYDAESARARNLVGARLAELRRSRGMTQGQLAAALAPFGVRVQTAAVSSQKPFPARSSRSRRPTAPIPRGKAHSGSPPYRAAKVCSRA